MLDFKGSEERGNSRRGQTGQDRRWDHTITRSRERKSCPSTFHWKSAPM